MLFKSAVFSALELRMSMSDDVRGIIEIHRRKRSSFIMNIEQRLTRLERHIRRWQLLSISLITLFVAAMLSGQADKPAKQVPAAERQTMTLDELVIRDSNQRRRVVLSGNTASFFDQHNRQRIVIGTAPDDTAAVVLYSTDGKQRIATLTQKDGTAESHFLDTRGRRRITIVTHRTDSAAITHMNPKGESKFITSIDANGVAGHVVP